MGRRQSEQTGNGAELQISQFKFINTRAAFGRKEFFFLKSGIDVSYILRL